MTAHRRPGRHALCSLLALTLLAAGLSAQSLPVSAPDREGVSARGLKRLHAWLGRSVKEHRYAGMVSLIARNGRVVDWRAFGYRDLERRLPMERDTIFRIYSMTKMMTAAAALTLYEEGRFDLNDPVARYIPEFSGVKVFAGGTPEAPVLVPPKRPVTILDLFRHTSGLTYDYNAPGPLQGNAMYAGVEVGVPSTKAFVERLVKLPLAHHPGEEFQYGYSTDVLGYLVEVISGKSLDVFMRERLFAPLKMDDTTFRVPAARRHRLAKIYERGPDNRLRAARPENWVFEETGVGIPGGGGGIYSTAADCTRFAQMLLDGGTIDGVRILRRKTVELMTTNHLAGLKNPHTDDPSLGYGLGVGVRVESARGGAAGTVGQFGWSGLATTYLNVDPKERTVAILLAQHLPYNEGDIFQSFSTLFYQAIE
jgi:CubicO group peptidase (beta-lactamase class C family)